MVGAALLGMSGGGGFGVGDQSKKDWRRHSSRRRLSLRRRLRHGHHVLIAYADEGDQADKRQKRCACGAEDLDVLRENWWQELREGERTTTPARLRSRRGKLSSWLHGALASEAQRKAYSDVEDELRTHMRTRA
jgi:hypothetical protein